MPRWADEYNEALHRARRQFTVPDRLVAALYREYAEMLVRIEEEALRGIITPQRAELLRQSIMQEIARFAVRFERLLSRGALEAAELAASAHLEGLQRASTAAGVSVSHSFASVPTRAIENMMIRRGIDLVSSRGRGGFERGGLSGAFETLVRRHIRNLQPEIDRILTSAVARGQSAGRLAQELAVAMTRDDPQLALALERIGPRGQTLLRALHEGRLSDITDVPELRRLLYDARRIAVSEINNAYDESDKLAARESPVVDLLRWTVSGRHAGLTSSPDACDVAAQVDLHGLGPGVYHPETVPSLLHPHCGCGTQKILRQPANWRDPKRPIPPMRLVSTDEIKAIMPKASEGMVKAQRKMFNQKVRSAYAALEVPIAA